MSAPFVLKSAFEAYGLTPVFGPQMLFFSIIHTGGVLVLLLLASCVRFLLSIVGGLVMLVARRFSATAGALRTRALALTTVALSIHAGLIVTYEWWSLLWPARLVSIAALVYLIWTTARVVRCRRLTNGWAGS